MTPRPARPRPPARPAPGRLGTRRAAAQALLWLGAALLPATAARADTVRVAVAANFAGPMARIAEGFRAATGHQLSLATGATGKFYGQILHGAPFEVLLAADEATPRQLVSAGHAVAGSQFSYAIGVLVLWSAQPGLVDAQGAVLASGRFRKLAIANPKLAPYGAAALSVVQAKGLAEALAPRLVVGENIAQAYQFVATGNAELGFVALSQLLQAQAARPGQAAEGSHWRVPAGLHAEIRQDAVLLQPGAGSAAARALLDYLQSPAARAIIQAGGYTLPALARP